MVPAYRKTNIFRGWSSLISKMQISIGRCS